MRAELMARDDTEQAAYADAYIRGVQAGQADLATVQAELAAARRGHADLLFVVATISGTPNPAQAHGDLLAWARRHRAWVQKLRTAATSVLALKPVIPDAALAQALRDLGSALDEP